jgi:ethanolamine utilization protein EutP (predicted NTPase)
MQGQTLTDMLVAESEKPTCVTNVCSKFTVKDTVDVSTGRRWLTHCGRVKQICVFNTVKLGTSTSSL